jgi:hypothetical protein
LQQVLEIHFLQPIQVAFLEQLKLGAIFYSKELALMASILTIQEKIQMPKDMIKSLMMM